jgi:hypothetical protein
MSQQRSLASQVLDLVVHQPIRRVLELCEQAPVAVAEGRTRFAERVKVARWVGEMAVNYGRIELERRLEPAPAVPAAAVDVAAQQLPVANPQPLAPPFDGYDQLAAAQVVQLLARLPHAELELIREYEQSRRARRTILAKIEQLLAA